MAAQVPNNIPAGNQIPHYLEWWLKINRRDNYLTEKINQNATLFFEKLKRSLNDWATPQNTNLTPRSTQQLQNDTKTALSSLIFKINNECGLQKLDLFMVQMEKLLQENKQDKAIDLLAVFLERGIPLKPRLIMIAYQKRAIQFLTEIVERELFLKFMFEGNLSQLHLACQFEMVEIVTALLEKGLSAAQEDDLGNTPLHYACEHCAENEGQFVFSLLQHGDGFKVVSHQNKAGKTALHMLCGTGNSDLAHVLIQNYKSDLMSLSKEEGIPFLCATIHNDIPVAKVLYKEIVPFLGVEKAKKFLEEALEKACFIGHLELVQLFIDSDEFGADINQNNCQLLKLAIEKGYSTLALYLINHNVIKLDLRKSNWNVFVGLACKYKAADSVLHALLKKISLSMEDLYCLVDRLDLIDTDTQAFKIENVNQLFLNRAGDKETALHAVCRRGNLRFVKFLVEKKQANILVMDSVGNQPLHLAAFYNHREIVEFLCDHGADLSIKGELDYTALQMALKNKSYSCAFLSIVEGDYRFWRANNF